LKTNIADHGEIILYQSAEGEAAIDVHLKEETVCRAARGHPILPLSIDKKISFKSIG
jgi:hypothetical protein